MSLRCPILWATGIFCLALAITIGCNSGGSSGSSGSDPGAFAGTYSGTFSGDDSGSFSVTVDASGQAVGTGISNQAGAFTITGSVDPSGSFAAGVASTGATWSGTVDSTERLTGTWSNAGRSGTFGGSTAGVFARSYSGTFDGDDTGTFSVTIDRFGVVSGTGFSNQVGAFILVGSVDGSGNLAAGIASTNASWNGVVNLVGMISGTWTNSGNSGAFASAGSFSGLGSLPGGSPDSIVGNVSADGNVIVGTSSSHRSSQEAVRWDTGSISRLADQDACGQIAGVPSFAAAASSDGSVVVGISKCGGFRWESGSYTLLSDLPGGGKTGIAWDVSGDGSVVVGSAGGGPGGDSVAFRWENGSTEAIGSTPSGGATFQALGVSFDGSVIVGSSSEGGGFVWENGVVSLLLPLPGDSKAEGHAVSPDGVTMVGLSQAAGERAKAAIWIDRVPSLIGRLPEGGSETSNAFDVSADGSRVVGTQSLGGGDNVAFVWSAAGGIEAMPAFLESFGLNVDGWQLTEGLGVSDDGRTVVGNGVNPDGYREGWVAVIPQPSP